MEEITLVAELVGQVGFPIAIAIALFYQNMKNNELLKQMTISLERLSIAINEGRQEKNV